MIDFGKRLTQKDKRKGTFFFPSIIRQKHTSESREKKREVLLAKNSAVVTRVPHLCICKYVSMP